MLETSVRPGRAGRRSVERLDHAARAEADPQWTRLAAGAAGPPRSAAAGRSRRAPRRPRRPRPRRPRPAVATSTLRKPWWVKPVSGSVCRSAWCSPAVSLNGSSRSRQAQITAASSTGVGNSSAASPPVRNFGAMPSPSARAPRRPCPARPAGPRSAGSRRTRRRSAGRRAAASSRRRPGCGSSPRLATGASTWRTRSRGSAALDVPRSSRSSGTSPIDARPSSRSSGSSSAAASAERRRPAPAAARPASAYQAARCSRCAGDARRAAVALPGGKTAASSTRPREQRRDRRWLTRTMNLVDATDSGQQRPIIGRCRPVNGTKRRSSCRTTAASARCRAKRHTQFRQPDGGLYAEELMGQEGFSSDSSLLYHRHLPTAIVAAEEYRPARLDAGCRTGRSSRATCAPTSSTRAGADAGARPAAPAGQRRRAGSRTSSPTGPRRSTATRSATSACTSSPARRRIESHVRRAGRDRRRLRDHPDLGDPPDRAGRRRAGADADHRGDRAHRPAQALPVGARAVPGARAVLRARPARAGRAAAGRRHRRRGVRPAPPRLDPARVRPPPVRRGRLGRLPLPVGVLHPRLRADHRAGAPAAAGAPDVPGPELRDLLVRARARSTTTRWRSRCRTTTTTSTPTR